MLPSRRPKSSGYRARSHFCRWPMTCQAGRLRMWADVSISSRRPIPTVSSQPRRGYDPRGGDRDACPRSRATVPQDPQGPPPKIHDNPDILLTGGTSAQVDVQRVQRAIRATDVGRRLRRSRFWTQTFVVHKLWLPACAFANALRPPEMCLSIRSRNSVSQFHIAVSKIRPPARRSPAPSRVGGGGPNANWSQLSEVFAGYPKREFDLLWRIATDYRTCLETYYLYYYQLTAIV